MAMSARGKQMLDYELRQLHAIYALLSNFALAPAALPLYPLSNSSSAAVR